MMRTLFAFGPQEPRLAFDDVEASELYPVVMFYSSNPGEKVAAFGRVPRAPRNLQPTNDGTAGASLSYAALGRAGNSAF